MAETEALHILQITDLHLHADPDTELYGVKTDDSFRAIVEAAFQTGERSPDAVLITGDLVEDCSRQGYERFRSIMQPFALPVLCLPGNHDDPELMSQLLDDGDFSYCASRDIGRWRFLMLDSHVPGEDGGELGVAELGRLEDELAASETQNVLIAVHHQPIDMGSAWLDGYGLQDSTDFISALSTYRNVRAVLWGHVHQASDREYDEMRMLSTPSTCAQFTPGTERCVMDIRPPGFRKLTLWPNGLIETEVVWLDAWAVTERPPDSRVEGLDRDRQ